MAIVIVIVIVIVIAIAIVVTVTVIVTVTVAVTVDCWAICPAVAIALVKPPECADQADSLSKASRELPFGGLQM